MTVKTLIKKVRRNENHHKKLYFLALIFLGIILFLPVFLQIRYHELRSFGLLGVFLLNLIGSATIFFPTPAFVSVGITATQTNPLLVAFVAALGAALGEGTTFLFGLTSIKVFSLEKHKVLKKLKKIIHNKWGAVVILAFAFIPNPFFDGIGILAGLSRFPIKRFLLLTFFGRLLRYIVIGYVSVYIALR